MNGIQGRKARPVPGCLGNMVNLFDLSAGAARTQLLTDRPHRDDCLFSRSQSDVSRISSPIRDQIDNMLVVSELRRNSSNGKLNGTPMKMLIAREMSNELESKRNSPNLVAKLMGLEALPQGLPTSAAQGIHSRDTQSAVPLGCSRGEHEFFDRQRHGEINHGQEQSEFKDVYEIWQQSENTNVVKDSSPQKGTRTENTNEKRMALIRQKFIEAKRLSTDEKLRQSKEFQDALELLNSNRDLLIEFLQEPNSLFSQYEMRSSQLPQTRQITVLRPSKIVDNDKVSVSGENMEKQTKKLVWTVQENGRDKSNYRFPPASSSWKADDKPTQMTRIVVLKPSPGKTHDIKAISSPPCLSPRTVNGRDFCGKLEDDELQSKELAEEITDHMHESLSSHRRDETLLSSVLSNGYIGDISSFNKSENEFEVGNLSDSEFMSPSSRHSWDHINRFDSPYCSSSFSRASFSPESSVCREAKKRISERWALMASNGICQEQRHTRSSSNTLGEMLALPPDMKSSARSDEGSSKDRDLEESSARLSINVNKGEGVDNSPRNLLRSKSVPVSSTMYGDRLNIEVSDADTSKIHGSKELSKPKSGKSSFKGKVTSLFFSRNKKLSKEKSCKSPIDISNSATTGTPGFLVHPTKYSTDMSPCFNKNGFEGSFPPRLQESISRTSQDLIGGMELGLVSQASVLHAAKSGTLGNPSENQEQQQPSPISVLMPTFEEDDSTTPESSCSIKQDQPGKPGMQRPVPPPKSNLIDKSPPIEPMVRRALSWDDYSAQLATPYMLKQHLASPRTKEEEHNWLLLVRDLFAVAGLDSEVQPISVLSRWHSPENLLGPSLREKYVSPGNIGLMHEAKKRQWRSNRMLVFDCVNAALSDIIGYESSMGPRIGLCNGGRDGPLHGPSSHPLADGVWAQIKEWGTAEVAEDGGDRDSLVVDRVARKEVVGVGWVDGMRRGEDTVGEKIGGELLEELLEEAVIELTRTV